MEALVNEFSRIVEKGGPEPSDYVKLNRLIDSFGYLIRKGILPVRYLPLIWNRFGDVFSLKTLQGHVCRKPHGYAGDFEIIDKMYVMETSNDPHLMTWDNYFHNHKAVSAVRNRKAYFKALLRDLEGNKPGQKLNVLNIGSGPGRDLYEFFMENPGTCINFDCVDMDKKAVNYAKSLCAGFLDSITFHNRNALRHRPKMKYDLIWSAGLFDYLSDSVFVHLVKHYIKFLKPDGEMVIGNFSTGNPSRSYMEFGQWNLIHRSEKQLKSLALQCGIDESTISIGNEPEGINLFLHVKK